MIEWPQRLLYVAGLGEDPARAQGRPRSPRWPGVRRVHLAAYPWCAACGRKDHLEVHHVRPFHLHPELELDPANLLTLCDGGGRSCHFFLGHGGASWADYIPTAAADAAYVLGAMARVVKGG